MVQPLPNLAADVKAPSQEYFHLGHILSETNDISLRSYHLFELDQMKSSYNQQCYSHVEQTQPEVVMHDPVFQLTTELD